VTSQRFLVVLDVDSTLTRDEGIDLLAESVSPEVAAQVAAITESAMHGHLDFAESLVARVRTLEGVSLTQVGEAAARVRLTLGAQSLIDTLHGAGHLVGAVSGGFHEMIDPLASNIGLDVHRANRFETVDSVLTGRIAGRIVDSRAKADALRQWAKDFGIPLWNTIAVGDGGNDVEMLRTAGVGIAFMAKQVAKDAADVSIDIADLSLVLEHMKLG
jgi:phosphoserine phosphatase